MKDRVTLTLDRDILRIVDDRVDGTRVKNRSHAIELLLRHSLRSSIPSVAVILAGGRGEQLRPLTEHKPKALVEMNGKPILQYNIDLCKKHGINNIILSVGFLGDQIKQYYGDGSKFGVNITYIEEQEPLGTAGPLRKLRDTIKEGFVVLNGDNLKDVNITKLYQAHVEHDAKVTIALTTVDDPSAYGVAMLDGSRILRFVEKPAKADAPSKLINAGLYIMEADVLSLIPEGFSMLETDVFPKLAKDGGLYGYPFSGQWFDLATVAELELASREWRAN